MQAAATPPAETAAAAYGRLCAPGAAALSATTCQAMKRDLDGAATSDGEAAKVADFPEWTGPSR